MIRLLFKIYQMRLIKKIRQDKIRQNKTYKKDSDG